MNVNRRHFLFFFAAVAGSVASGSRGQERLQLGNFPAIAQTDYSSLSSANSSLGFKSVKVPLPLEIEQLPISEQIETYGSYEVKDDLVLPKNFTYDLIAAWGDRVGDSRFGYNNDYLSLIETVPNEGYLTVNFEYISGGTWMQTYPLVIGKQLPFTELIALTKPQEGEIDAFSLTDNDQLKGKIRKISREGLIDQGLGVISVKRNADGIWERTYSDADRRVTGISGLDNPERSLRSTGAAVAIFTKANKLGYEDGLGDRIIGTFQNCAGGTTPWGTVLSAEENFQDQVPEPVMADGSSLHPSATPFLITDEDLDGRGNVFGLAGNKYGWMVEIDPANPDDYGTKHTWLGRYRHEAFGIRAVAGKNLAVYSGCDRRGGHLYKFISSGQVNNPQDKSNSRLFEDGMLYGAKFYPNGIGEWIPLNPDTLVNPVSPNQVVGGIVILPNSDRAAGGVIEVTTEEQMQPMVTNYKTLGDIYQGDSPQETQGAILIDAHFAANAAGITCTARPEDTIVNEEGILFIAFTSGSDGSDGGPDKAIFVGPDGESNYEYGWIMKLEEDDKDPASLSFTWSMLATGGEPAKGGAGFANPDNLSFDRAGNLWMVTDMSTSTHNVTVPARTENRESLSGKDLLGVFGNNSLWYVPLTGDDAGNSYPFAIGPMECECTGLTFDSNNSNLFLAIQHPGERNGIRQNMAAESRNFELLATDGTVFKQQRQVPIGSNWPSGKVNQPPLPGVVAIRRVNEKNIV
ncbi:PhoX family phosphatase [Pleurocapsa sp. PCC 7319]|uniref:PhoX family protein n=1 Tax=Pleurocapsa sp. PCC 7319 TaxID=118161 RepID=UPI00034C3E70|nr:alkaline phosphatase PhoX [Pleurocapsa sp. PCC 7319]